MVAIIDWKVSRIALISFRRRVISLVWSSRALAKAAATAVVTVVIVMVVLLGSLAWLVVLWFVDVSGGKSSLSLLKLIVTGMRLRQAFLEFWLAVSVVCSDFCASWVFDEIEANAFLYLVVVVVEFPELLGTFGMRTLISNGNDCFWIWSWICFAIS